MAGAKKRKASKKKNKKGETLDSNNQHHHGNDSSTHSHGSVDEFKSLEERDSDGGELEREEEEEEEILYQREVDTKKGEGLEEQVVEVAREEISLENGSGSADFSSVNVEEETAIAVPASEEDIVAENFDVEDKEVAVVEEDEKAIIAECEELKEENTNSLALDDKEIVDFVKEEVVVGLNESVEPQIIGDDEEEDPVKEVVKLAPEEVVSAAGESFMIPIPPVVVDSELTNNVDSSFSQISDQKDEFSSVIEAQKSEQIENPVKVVPLDDEEKPSEAPAVSNGVANGGKPLETDNQGAAVVINTSREVDNGKELEIQKKPTEDQVPILCPYEGLPGRVAVGFLKCFQVLIDKRRVCHSAYAQASCAKWSINIAC
ncbi:hypothetical protein V2J09_019601 [Rumex salicifolius]